MSFYLHLLEWPSPGGHTIPTLALAFLRSSANFWSTSASAMAEPGMAEPAPEAEADAVCEPEIQGAGSSQAAWACSPYLQHSIF